MARKADPAAFATFEAFRDADPAYRRAKAASLKAADRRAALPPGSSRARITTANAKWGRAAEARDRMEEDLRAIWEARTEMKGPRS